VIFFRFDGEMGVRAIVDLSRKSVGEVSRLSSREVPMTQTDLAEAWNLASRNAEVREALGADAQKFQVEGRLAPGLAVHPRYAVEALRLEVVADNDPCYKHRCLYLLFRRGGDYLMKPSVVVDLSAQSVRIERRER
jgi:hypothetical protein